MAVTAQCLYYNYTMIENYTFLRNESQFLKFLYFREVVVSAKCLFDEKSARHTVGSSYCPFDKMSVPLSVRRQNVRSAKCLSAKCLSAKCLSAKCPGTCAFYKIFSTSYIAREIFKLITWTTSFLELRLDFEIT